MLLISTADSLCKTSALTFPLLDKLEEALDEDNYGRLVPGAVET